MFEGLDAGLDPTGRAGTVLGDRYEIQAWLGEGGAGAVYRAVDRTTGATVAIKILRMDHVENERDVARFRRELKAAIRIQHPNVVRVEEVSTTASGEIYLAMEFLRGEDLDAVITSRGRLPWRNAVAIGLGVARGLAAAHRQGVIHRDIKPANIFLTEEEGGKWVTKLVDFGAAKITYGDGSTALTRVGEIYGTPAYMSPEQALGETIDERTDIYSTAVVLFEMLTGKPPFDAGDPVQILRQHINAPVPNVRTLAPTATIPAAVEEVMLKALTKDRKQRYQAVRDFASALAHAAQPKPKKPEDPEEAKTQVYPAMNR